MTKDIDGPLWGLILILILLAPFTVFIIVMAMYALMTDLLVGILLLAAAGTCLSFSVWLTRFLTSQKSFYP